MAEDLNYTQIWRTLEAIQDPEIPVVSLVDLGIVHSVGIEGETVIVALTPTFSGCPALGVMQEEIKAGLLHAGAQQVQVKLLNQPAWSTNWITQTGRRKLQEFGIAPPPLHDGNLAQALARLVACPYCSSTETVVKNDFGPTLCRAIRYCHHCQQPFEQFKPI